MARARNIKPALFMNEYLGTADIHEMVLFEGLWCLADREGRLENRPLKIAAQVFPYRGFSTQVISGMIRNLSSNGFLVEYEVGGEHFIEITNFVKHQNPHRNEKPSEIPEPKKGEAQSKGCADSGNYQSEPDKIGSARASSLIPDSLNSDSPIPDSLSKGSTSDDDSPGRNDLVRSFPLKDKTEGRIDDAYVVDLQAAYPKLDVENELQRARLWLVSNPAKGKTKAGLKKFLNGWMSRQGAHQKTSASVHQFPSRHVGLTDRDLTEGMEEQADGTYRF